MIVPLAWLMMAYPSLVLARSLTTRWVVPLAAVGLTTWDLFLDPQMVGEGYWVWETKTGPAGYPGIPLQNYAGWLAGTLLLMWLLNRLPRRDVDLGVPCCSTAGCGSGIVANAVFLDRPAVAVIGGWGWPFWAFRRFWRGYAGEDSARCDGAAAVLCAAASTLSLVNLRHLRRPVVRDTGARISVLVPRATKPIGSDRRWPACRR